MKLAEKGFANLKTSLGALWAAKTTWDMDDRIQTEIYLSKLKLEELSARSLLLYIELLASMNNYELVSACNLHFLIVYSLFLNSVA